VASSDVNISDGRDEPIPLLPKFFSFLRTFAGLRCAAGDKPELLVAAADRDVGLLAVDPSCDGPKYGAGTPTSSVLYDTGLSKPEAPLLNLSDGAIVGS
jgi:hypothetical protein